MNLQGKTGFFCESLTGKNRRDCFNMRTIYNKNVSGHDDLSDFRIFACN